MNIALNEVDLPVRLRFERPVSDEALWRFCSTNDELRVERDANGELIVMSPTGLEGSGSNAEIIADLILWRGRMDGARSSIRTAALLCRMGRCEFPTLPGYRGSGPVAGFELVMARIWG